MYTSLKIASLLSLLALQVQANFVNKTTLAISAKVTATSATAAAATGTSTALNATVLDCFLTLPNNPLSAAGLSTPFLLNAPCSQTVATQQAFAEAAIYDPATGAISIYHPLVLDAGKTAGAPPVVPNLPAGAVVALWFGFNGGVLQLLDVNGKDTNASPVLKGAGCINGLEGVQGDVFGQVSWCNAQPWFAAANAGIASGKTVIPPLGVDNLGNACPTSRSFEITDACPSDNVPTQYLLLADGSTAQDNSANRAANPTAEVINNASDEALLTNIINPLIGCTSYTAPYLDNPGVSGPALALSELQANTLQQAPIGLVPLNDPDTLLTASGTVSTQKTNQYRLGVNQPVVAAGANSGALAPYCQNMVTIAPPFFKGFQSVFITQTTPAATVGNNLFTFLCERYLMSLTQLTCPPAAFQPVVCQVDGNGAATSCVITLPANSTTSKASTTALATKASTTSLAAKVLANSTTQALSTTQLALVTNSTKALATATLAVATNSTKNLGTATLAVVTNSTKNLGTATLAAGTNSTKALSTTALATSLPTKLLTTALTASTKPTITSLAATTTKTTTIIIEVVTFFIFTLSLGGSPPGVLPNPNSQTLEFIVLEEVFIDLPSAASAACTHQFNACVALAGTAFSGTDCLSQMNTCNGVASTASATATTPATLTVAATVPASSSSTALGRVQTPVAANAVAGSASGNGGGGSCPAAPALTVTACTATAVQTVTVTALSGASGAAAPTLAARHFHGHLKQRAKHF
jgi:hypothetical protein